MRIVLLASTICLSGCCTGPEVVYVPVSSCVEPPAFSMPTLQVDQLPEAPDTRQAVEALANDYVVLKNHLKQCIILLDGYRGP